jgi:hypothetical protein
MEVIKPNNINYKTVAQASGKYRYLRLPLNNITGNTVTLSNTASQLLEFKLPVSVYNLARSFVSYTDSNIIDAGGAIYAYDNTLPIAQSITFGTAGGLNLADVNYANNYINVARPIDTPYDVFETQDVTSKMSPFPTGGPTTLLNVFPPTFSAQANNIYSLAVNATTSVNPSANAIMDVRQSITAVLGLVGATNFALAGVTNTILAMDRDQYFGPDNMYLRINTAVQSKVAYSAAAINLPAGTPANLAANSVLKNIYLYLAIEKDQLIIDSLLAKYASGNLKYQIPYTTSFRNAVGSGASTVQINLNAQYGKKLKRVLTTFFNANELTGGASSNLAYDHHNWNAAKVTSYQTYLDSMPLQDSILACAQPTTDTAGIAAGTAGVMNMDDWKENKANCKGSALRNAMDYQLHWFHADKFYEKNEHSNIPEDNIDEGLSLAETRSWSIQSTNVAALTNYTFCSFVRDILISPSGPMYF